MALFHPLFDLLRTSSVSPDTLQETIKTIRTRELAAELARKALAISDGLEPVETLSQAISEYSHELHSVEEEASDEEKDFVDDSLESLIHHQLSSNGLHWRLPSLNKALGPLRKGNFGFVFARPETGKTTFLASELSFMAEQAGENPILLFNNEEEGETKLIRVYQASLGITLQELKSDVPRHYTSYKERTRSKVKLIDDPSITAGKIEQLCDKYQPGLIVFDQIDKIKGFAADRSDLELASIYRWSRELAKAYAPVIGICQAGASGDGKKWLTMNDVDNSKTGKQAEADWILGIGKTFEPGLDNLRYLHLSKNKLPGGDESDPAMRHGRWEVLIKPEIARYEDLQQ